MKKRKTIYDYFGGGKPEVAPPLALKQPSGPSSSIVAKPSGVKKNALEKTVPSPAAHGSSSNSPSLAKSDKLTASLVNGGDDSPMWKRRRTSRSPSPIPQTEAHPNSSIAAAAGINAVKPPSSSHDNDDLFSNDGHSTSPSKSRSPVMLPSPPMSEPLKSVPAIIPSPQSLSQMLPSHQDDPPSQYPQDEDAGGGGLIRSISITRSSLCTPTANTVYLNSDGTAVGGGGNGIIDSLAAAVAVNGALNSPIEDPKSPRRRFNDGLLSSSYGGIGKDVGKPQHNQRKALTPVQQQQGCRTTTDGHKGIAVSSSSASEGLSGDAASSDPEGQTSATISSNFKDGNIENNNTKQYNYFCPAYVGTTSSAASLDWSQDYPTPIPIPRRSAPCDLSRSIDCQSESKAGGDVNDDKKNSEDEAAVKGRRRTTTSGEPLSSKLDSQGEGPAAIRQIRSSGKAGGSKRGTANGGGVKGDTKKSSGAQPVSGQGRGAPQNSGKKIGGKVVKNLVKAMIEIPKASQEVKSGDEAAGEDENDDAVGAEDEVKAVGVKAGRVPSPSESEVSGAEDEIIDDDEEDEVNGTANGLGVLSVPIDCPKGRAIVKLSAALQKKGMPPAGSTFSAVAVNSKTPASTDFGSAKFDPAGVPDADIRGKGKTSPPSLLFATLAQVFDAIEQLKGSGAGSRRAITVQLTNLFRLFIWHCPTDLYKVAYICLNRVCPDYEGLEVGIGESIIVKVMTEVYGRTDASIKQDVIKNGDLGKVAEISRCKMRTLYEPPPLTVAAVFDELKTMTAVTGDKSQQRKKEKLKKLLVAAKRSEPKYIIRFLQGGMRMGVQSVSIYQALAFAFILTRPATPVKPIVEISADGDAKDDFLAGAERCSDIRRIGRSIPPVELESRLTAMDAAVRTALSQVSNIEVVVKYLLEGCTPADLAERCVVTPGIPVQPMLAKPTKGLQEVFDRFSNIEFTCEFKYDGERAQVHLLPNGEVMIFSRNLENLTPKYPDVIQMMREAFTAETTDCILDAEVVAFDTETNQIRPFQILSTRKRKDVEAEDVKVQVCLFAFDCIRRNGRCLTKVPLEDRRKEMRKSFNEVPHRFQIARHAEMSAIEDVDQFLQESIDNACEGLMVKTLRENASYEPSKRSLNWLKIKKDYVDSISDTVDLVPIGAFYGRGKRSNVFGTYLMAVYNPDEETFQSVCRIATGYTDEMLQSAYDYYTSADRMLTTKLPYYDVHERMTPDVWFSTSQVWECKAADLSISPVHTAGRGLKVADKGIGLRFPRFLRIREDKKVEQATTSYQICEMYSNQFTSNAGGEGGRKKQKAAALDELSDY